jgi:hypothetical protein
MSSDDTSASIAFHPRSKWVNQPTTAELLDKKLNLRNAFTMNIDFLDHKRPIMSNAHAKLERLEASGPQSNGIDKIGTVRV